jgi:hypothetical protein
MDDATADSSQPPSETRTDPAAPAGRRRWLPAWIARPVRWCWTGLRLIAQFLLIRWAVSAIYYSNLPWAWTRMGVAAAFAGFGVWALWFRRGARGRWAFAGAIATVVAWWVCIPPSHDRPWRREVAVMSRAFIDGDRVRLTGFRHFRYRTRDDFDVRYEEREVRLSHLASVDLFVSYWTPGPVAHTFVSFDFDDGTLPVCVSIEARPEVGEGFEPLASNFKQFELIYVVGDERDLVRVRTEYRAEEVFLYRIRATPAVARRLFRIYLQRINELADRPEWYHLLSNNCTLNIIRYARRAAGVEGGRFDHRHLLNGLIDRYVYGVGAVDTSLPFEELRSRSHINGAAHGIGDAEDFSDRIRASLPVPVAPPASETRLRAIKAESGMPGS